MEDRVRSLEIANAKLATSVEHLSTTVGVLAGQVQNLNDTMNRGRGALWMAMATAGSIGALVATFAKRVFGFG